ncbi:MAG TPA: peptidoglycan-binding domain-containing protein [Actinomycetota bacterium]|jgi:peptidoglycan hydrolase-like protein with peptidoglycan-binding domain|uniref:Putative peptidoglycan binding domain-containing protein n=1 Tax=Tessaracoccus bendigoensis DSM 12906 TaxID=1123357 RepID=A0A1M6HG43_9ACTN|nr:Putative peptidoglycan binding domain-containing protein [Tessaracoccus bendigoensis DSM 12906]HQZ85219.1 peptidoglycan-binding domain-containing protein [Actinomycetota bacterium]
MSAGGRSRVVVAVLALGAPLLVGVVLAVWALADSPLQSATRPQPLIGTVELAERRDVELTSVTLIPAEPYPVVSQSTGTVTALSITSGEAIGSGATALAVDGRPVVAYVSAAPLYRDIVEGLEGDDVAAAQRLLADLGHLDAVDGRAGSPTTAAIRAFNAAQGYGEDNGVLAVGSLLWVPEGSAAPQSVTIRVGQLVAPQTELYMTASGEDRIEVGAPEADVDRLLTVGSVTATLGSGQTTLTDPADIEAIKTVLGGETTAGAALESITPRTVGTVPASAVVVGTDGVACFFTDLQGPGTRIDAAAGSFGLVDVDADLIGTPVLINPRTTREDLACDS